MVLLHQNITFLNFDGTYVQQKALTSACPHRWIDFHTLRGTSLYCAPGAFQTIHRQLADVSDKGLTFIGSGNYHYTSLALMQRIHRPFTLILLDHHTDLNEGQIGSLLSCGSWVHYAVTGLASLHRIVMIGPHPADTASVPALIRHQVVVIPDQRIPDDRTLLALIPTDHVYLSIDKDVLAPPFVKTNWDQGKLRLDELCRLLRLIVGRKKAEGIDVCGEWPIRPHDHFNRQVRSWLARNEQANLRILTTVRDLAPAPWPEKQIDRPLD